MGMQTLLQTTMPMITLFWVQNLYSDENIIECKHIILHSNEVFINTVDRNSFYKHTSVE